MIQRSTLWLNSIMFANAWFLLHLQVDSISVVMDLKHHKWSHTPKRTGENSGLHRKTPRLANDISYYKTRQLWIVVSPDECRTRTIAASSSSKLMNRNFPDLKKYFLIIFWRHAGNVIVFRNRLFSRIWYYGRITQTQSSRECGIQKRTLLFRQPRRIDTEIRKVQVNMFKVAPVHRSVIA